MSPEERETLVRHERDTILHDLVERFGPSYSPERLGPLEYDLVCAIADLRVTVATGRNR